jgi:hypothetical protein
VKSVTLISPPPEGDITDYPFRLLAVTVFAFHFPFSTFDFPLSLKP